MSFISLQEVKESIGNIEKAGFTPGAPFPENRDLQEGEVKLWITESIEYCSWFVIIILQRLVKFTRTF